MNYLDLLRLLGSVDAVTDDENDVVQLRPVRGSCEDVGILEVEVVDDVFDQKPRDDADAAEENGSEGDGRDLG